MEEKGFNLFFQVLHCSPLPTICGCLQTMTKLLFRKKKLSFRRLDEKKSIHYLSQTAVFTNVCKACYTLFVNRTNREQTGRIRNKTLFLQKQGELAAILCSLFTVNFRVNIFATGSTFVFVEETAISMQILWIAYGKKPVCETCQTSTIHYLLYVLISSFHPCFVIVLQIVYSWLNNWKYGEKSSLSLSKNHLL